MEDDDWSQLNLDSNHNRQVSAPQNQMQSQNSVTSNPFANIIRIEAYFQQNIKLEASEEPLKVTKVQDGTGFLIGKTKVFTSASLLYSNQTKTQANYILLYPQSSEEKFQKKGIKSKNFHVNEYYKFENSYQKFSNNFAIIYTQQNLIQSSVWQPFQLDWTYDEDYESKENVTTAGYRWKESQKVYEKVFKQFKPQNKKNGVFMTESKLSKGEEGSPLIIREKDEKGSAKIIYKVVGILTKSGLSTANAIEFGYLVQDKQIVKKQTKTLGGEVLFNIHASKAYQDLRKQQLSRKQEQKGSKIKKQDEPPNNSNDISQMLTFSLAEKTSRINELQHKAKFYQEQLAVIKDEKSIIQVKAEQVNELSTIIFTLKEENDLLNRKLSELIDTVEDLELQKKKVLHLTQREKELMAQNENLKAEIVVKNNELTQKTIEILALQKNESKTQVKPSTQAKKQVSSNQSQQSSSQVNSLASQPQPSSSQVSSQAIQDPKSPKPSTQIQQIPNEYQYIIMVFDTDEQIKDKYHKPSQQQIEQIKSEMNVSLNKQCYTLNHSKMYFSVEMFVKYYWENLELLDLSESGVDNQVWQQLAISGFIMPKLKVLILTDNGLNQLQPDTLDSFLQLRVFVLDSSNFTQLRKNAFKTYEQKRGGTLKVIFK